MSAREFRPAPRLARVVVALLGGNIVTGVLLTWVSLIEIDLLHRVDRGELVSAAELIRSDDRSRVVGILTIVVVLVTAVVWIVWQRRAQANLHARHVPGLRFTPGWAAGWWLIPIANLWMPYQTVRELWTASDGDPGWARSRTWPVLGWWWAAWVASTITGRISFGLLGAERPTLDELVTSDRWAIASALTSIAAAILAIAIVRSIDRRQERLRPPPAFTPPPVPPPPPPAVP